MPGFKILFFCCIFWFSCSVPTSKNTNSSEVDASASTMSNDSLALQKLVRNLYHWVEFENSDIDFDVIQNSKSDTAYSYLNRVRHNERIEELKKTEFFSEEFLRNYNNIANIIDKKLKNKTLVYLVGDMPPYGSGANPWCNCQDFPDNYGASLTIGELRIEQSKATSFWSWGGSSVYKLKAFRDSGVWKIDYLEGFDSDNFFAESNL